MEALQSEEVHKIFIYFVDLNKLKIIKRNSIMIFGNYFNESKY